MEERVMRVLQRALMVALLPASLLAGCRLYEAPTYTRLTPAPGVRTLKVLFIGNSLTYYNDLPGMVQQFSAGEERPLEIDSVTSPYATLKNHYDNGAAVRRLKRGDWDYVVLQEFSTLAADNPHATVEDYKRFADELRSTNTKPIIFENWTHQEREADERKMRQTYTQVQLEIGGDVAWIGSAWKLCREQHPEIALFEDDRHPTIAGTYLTACMLYKTLYHKPAVGLPTKIDKMKLSPDVAAKLQAVADATGK